MLQQEGWTKERPGHPRKEPEPDPLTKEYLVDDCLVFLLKKVCLIGKLIVIFDCYLTYLLQGGHLINPEPIELFKSFHPDEDIVEIDVPLYIVENNVEDHYPIGHLQNEGKFQN